MTLDTLTPAAVREALHALRYANPLQPSPLLALDLVTRYLQTEGLADTPRSRAWALGRCIEAAVDEMLARMRGAASGAVPATAAAPPAELTAESELATLAADLRSGSAERLDWALVHWRYLSPTHQSAAAIGQALAVTERTVRNHVNRGISLLAAELRQREVAAAHSFEAATSAPPADRILVDEDAVDRGVVEILGELQALVSQHRPTLRISPAQLAEVARYPAAELIAYRLGRIAEWSLPRYRLDARFVELSLLVDLGEESQSGRWQVREERFDDLGAVLAAVAEPAVVLLGPPGSGKSTLLRRLEMDLAHEALGPGNGGDSPPLTFLISLNQYRAGTPDGSWPAPADWLAERWAARYPKLPPLAALAAERGVVYLLDGLNEMPHATAEGYRRRVGLWRQFLVEALRPAMGDRAVIACRTLDYSAPLSTPALRVPQVRLEPLTDDKVRDFLARYSPANAEALWPAIEGSEMLGALRWPFMLRLLVEAAEADPTNWQGDLAALFTSFVRRALVREVERQNPRLAPDGLLDRRDYERLVGGAGWRGPYELPERGTLLRGLDALAHGMQAQLGEEALQVRVGYDEALALVGGPDSEEVIRAGADLGVLDEDRAADVVMFQHQLVQEYFAARVLAREPEPERVAAAWRISDVQPGIREILETLPPAETLPGLPQTGWEETTLLAAAMMGEPEPFLRALMPHNLVLAGRAARLPAVREKIDADFLDELRWALVARSRDPKADLRARIDAGLALGWLGDPRFERRMGPHGEYLLPPLVEIPGGVYPIGDDESIQWEAPGLSVETTAHMPRHMVEVAAFQIGQFPVTNAEWACFMATGGYEDDRWWDTADGRRWRQGELANEGARSSHRAWRNRFLADVSLFERMETEGRFPSEKAMEQWRGWLALSEAEFEAAVERQWPAKRETEPLFWRDNRFNHPLQPVVGVSWYEARAYCVWLAAQSGLAIRLPTEVEWEAAARGAASLAYAWGNEFDRQKANTYETRVKRTTPVGVFPSGDSPSGASEMTGNVDDWTSSVFGAENDDGVPDYTYPYVAEDGREDPEAPPQIPRVVRGGSWRDGREVNRAADRYRAYPSGRGFSIGFRVVSVSPISRGR